MWVRLWKTQEKGEPMKFQNIMQTQLIIAGLATVLLFTGITKGQEISNTDFDDGPNAVPFAQPVPAQGLGNSSSTPRSAHATPAMEPTEGPVTGQQITDEQEASTILIWIGAVLVLIGVISLCARRPAKHLTRELGSRVLTASADTINQSVSQFASPKTAGWQSDE
jgi:hypothetical protein